MLLSTGLNGIIKKIEARLAELDPVKLPSNAELQDVLNKRDALTAMMIAAKGAIKWAERYSKLARELAAKERDPARRAELER